METDDLDVWVLDVQNGDVSKDWQVYNKISISIYWASVFSVIGSANRIWLSWVSIVSHLMFIAWQSPVMRWDLWHLLLNIRSWINCLSGTYYSEQGLSASIHTTFGSQTENSKTKRKREIKYRPSTFWHHWQFLLLPIVTALQTILS